MTGFYFSGHLAVSLKDLNISCPVQQGEIPVSLRAVSTDEEGHRLLGPSKEMTVTCPNKGSCNNSVPVIQQNVPMLLVPFLSINPFSTHHFSASEMIRTVHLQKDVRDAKSVTFDSLFHDNTNSEDYQQSLVDRNNVETFEDDTSSSQLMNERENERHHLTSENDTGGHRELHYEDIDYSLEQLQMYWRWAPFMRQSIVPWFPVQFSHQSYLSTGVPLRGKHLLHSIHPNSPETSISTARVLADFQMQSDADHQKSEQGNIESHSDNSASHIKPDSDGTVTIRNNHKVVECPFLEFMKSKSAKFSLNASNDDFELKISGQNILWKLLHTVDFSVHNDKVRERKLVSQDSSHEARADEHRTSESKVNNNLQHHLNVDTYNISSSHESTVAYTHQNYAPATTFIDGFTNEEVMQEEALTEKSSDINGLTANNSRITVSSLNDSQEVPSLVKFVENSPLPSLSSATHASQYHHVEKAHFSAHDDSSMNSGRESFHRENADEESDILMSTESEFHN